MSGSRLRRFDEQVRGVPLTRMSLLTCTCVSIATWRALGKATSLVGKSPPQQSSKARLPRENGTQQVVQKVE
eukprot:15477222-Alexandrium_andersonii.AAC.1